MLLEVAKATTEIWGNQGNDTLLGNEGNDRIHGA